MNKVVAGKNISYQFIFLKNVPEFFVPGNCVASHFKLYVRSDPEKMKKLFLNSTLFSSTSFFRRKEASPSSFRPRNLRPRKNL